jgi:hypothetical protein
MSSLVDQCMRKQGHLEVAIKSAANPNTAMKQIFKHIQDEESFGFDADAAAGAWQMIPVLL